MPISCHFRDCKALLVTSLTHVSGAIASVQTFTFFIVFLTTPLLLLQCYRVIEFFVWTVRQERVKTVTLILTWAVEQKCSNKLILNHKLDYRVTDGVLNRQLASAVEICPFDLNCFSIAKFLSPDGYKCCSQGLCTAPSGSRNVFGEGPHFGEI